MLDYSLRLIRRLSAVKNRGEGDMHKKIDSSSTTHQAPSATVRVLGIAGSPVKDGNLERFLGHMLDHARTTRADVDQVLLSRLRVDDCVHCNFCTRRQSEGRYCSLPDDGQQVFDKLESADVVVLASPVYIMRSSARLAALVDRMRVFLFGNIAAGRLRDKIGVSAAVAWARHGGVETTHLSHITAFLTYEMIPISHHHCISPLGASAVSSRQGAGRFDPGTRHGALEDIPGLRSGEKMIERAVKLARVLKRGRDNE